MSDLFLSVTGTRTVSQKFGQHKRSKKMRKMRTRFSLKDSYHIFAVFNTLQIDSDLCHLKHISSLHSISNTSLRCWLCIF